MDPTANLNEQRQLAARILSGDIDNLVTLAQTGEQLAELVIDLDEWRANGGFDPMQQPEGDQPGFGPAGKRVAS